MISECEKLISQLFELLLTQFKYENERLRR